MHGTDQVAEKSNVFSSIKPDRPLDNHLFLKDYSFNLSANQTLERISTLVRGLTLGRTKTHAKLSLRVGTLTFYPHSNLLG